jgi:hypothetical protein
MRGAAAIPKSVENGRAIIGASDRLPVEQAGCDLECGHGLRDQREALGPVVAVPGEQPHAAGPTAGHHSKAIVLDFVNPARAGRRSLGRTWEARLAKIREGAQTPQHVPYMEHTGARVESGGRKLVTFSCRNKNLVS